ncbi:MAG TPA: class I SAM-dependent methyltransferase [Thermoguttaceae bacterium]|nr:class I SAM-dependent methyltransferase [Thermoguttaceae bacterium]
MTNPKEPSVTFDIQKLAGQEKAWSLFAEMLAVDGHDNLKAASHGLARQFRGVDFRGKRVLDIGSGKGLMTVFAALSGAEHVVSMEPELQGSRSEVAQILQGRIERLALENVTVLPEDFNAWDPKGETFDIILSFQSLEHLDESPHHALFHSQTHERCVRITSRMRSLLNDGGLAVVTNACRYGLFALLRPYGIKRPWDRKVTNINWRIHQNPRVWRHLFVEGGFSRVNIIYPLPYSLRALKAVVANPVVNFSLRAAFCLHCHCGS